MSLKRAREYLAQFDADHRIEEHDQSSATVELAALAIGCQPAEIAKTLAFLDKEQKGFVVVTDGEAKIDNRKFKDQFKMKAKMCPPDQLVEKIGHEMGGVCPFGLQDGVVVYLDRSLQKHGEIHPACGTGNSSIRLTIPELERFSRFDRWVDVTK